GKSPERTGNAHPNLAPYEVFRASDGYFILAIGNDTQFARFTEFCGRPELAQDGRYATNTGRIENLASLRDVLAEIIIERPRAYWTEALDHLGISWGAINTLEEVFEDEQVQHRCMLQTLNHPKFGPIRLVGNPMVSAESRQGSDIQPPPSLGEHSHILSDLAVQPDTSRGDS